MKKVPGIKIDHIDQKMKKVPGINSDTDLKNAVLEIVAAVENESEGKCNRDNIDAKWLDSFVRAKNRESHDAERKIAKRRLMPQYLKLKSEGLQVGAEVDRKVTELLRAKPRRTASGVATITVLTKPWPCSGNCIFCPNDIRMPKSYIANEPACQRAQRWNFDPYLQVTSRLAALFDMGHNIDKIELIILGGTFSDYPRGYQTWFVERCFSACNEFSPSKVIAIKSQVNGNFTVEPHGVEKPSESTLDKLQDELNEGKLSYNKAWEVAYSGLAKSQAKTQTETLEQLFEQHKINETATSRIVGLVVETRPDSASFENLVYLRRLGCTKIQIGIQTLDEEVLDKNCRNISVSEIKRTLADLRILGFKSHVHMMPNLMGSTPEKDVKTYRTLVCNRDYMPDEVKIYPCCLVESARLTENYEDGTWKPYSDAKLLDVVTSCIAMTPAHTRISRMIRDISTTDIIAGNKKPNLRQLVETKLREQGKQAKIQEMRFREIAVDEVDEHELTLQVVTYETNNTTEHFLQWVTQNNRLAGFLRLSLPKGFSENENGARDKVENLQKFSELTRGARHGLTSSLPAMIREVHVYGKVSKLHSQTGAQHLGLGSKLIERACEIAQAAGFSQINVISAVGTREYYRKLGFKDCELYQTRTI